MYWFYSSYSIVGFWRAETVYFSEFPSVSSSAKQMWVFNRYLLIDYRPKKSNIEDKQYVCWCPRGCIVICVTLMFRKWRSSTLSGSFPIYFPWFQFTFPSCGTQLAWEFLREFPVLQRRMKKNVLPMTTWQTPETFLHFKELLQYTKQPLSSTA